MASLNLQAQWDALVTYLSGSDAAALAALGAARPAVKRGQPEQFEDILPLIVVDLTGSTQQRERASASNLHQTWSTLFRIYVSALGSSMATADNNTLAIVSAVLNDLAGAGSYLGTDRATVFAGLGDGWSWDPSNDNDLIGLAFIDVTVTFYRF